MQCGRVGSRLLFIRAFIWEIKWTLSFVYVSYGLPANPSAKGLEFLCMAKVISRKVWHFRAWRESFPEWFGVSALGESHFPNGLWFPRMARVVSRKVWHFRAWRKLFPEWFCVCGPPANHFLKVLTLTGLPQISLKRFWRYAIKQNSINKRISENKRKKYQH